MQDTTRPLAKRVTTVESVDVLDALPHPVLVVDGSDHICFVNNASQLFFETSAVYLMQMKIHELLPKDSPLISLIDQARRTSNSINEYNVEITSPKMPARRVDILVSPVSDVSNHLMIMLQDRGMADRITRQLTHRDSARSVTGMAAILAHEIKNPLASIRGAAQLLEQSLPAEDAGLTSLIRDEADRICRLVDRMQIFAEANTAEYHGVNIHNVLDRVENIAKTSFGGNIEITKAYDPSLPPIWGDRDQLIQVFLNLVSNAADAVPKEGGKIHITTAYRPGMRLSLPGSRNKVNLPLEVQISDNGPGVPKAIFPNMFDPFVTSKVKGQGLGLALVAKIVGDHGGIIDCENSDDGANFRVLLPIYQAPAD